jgi:4-hydroxybenzoate polyprenyltransferase
VNGAFLAYLRERFPPAANGLLILAYYAANHFLGQVTAGPGGALGPSWRFLGGATALLLMFFHLRVIDEHKDYASDLVVHPDRVLSRGLVTLADLRRAGVAAVAIELAISAWLGPAALGVCLAVLVMSWVIAHDLFARRHLERHRFLSAFLHLLIMPLFSVYALAVATGLFPWAAPPAALAYAWVGYGAALAYEVARKTRAPADERPGLVTYSAVAGPAVAAGVAVAALAASGLLSIGVGRSLGFGSWYHATVLALLVGVAGVALRFRRRPSPRTAARLATGAGLFIVLFDGLLVAELVRLHGWAWPAR